MAAGEALVQALGHDGAHLQESGEGQGQVHLNIHGSHLAAEHLLDQHRDARPELGRGLDHFRHVTLAAVAVCCAELEVVYV